MPMDQIGRSTIAVIALVGVVAIGVAVWMYRDVGVPDQALDPPIGPTLPVGSVDDERIRSASVDEPGAWLAYGQGFEEQRFSNLTEINQDSVSKLGIAWTKAHGIKKRNVRRTFVFGQDYLPWQPAQSKNQIADAKPVCALA